MAGPHPPVPVTVGDVSVFDWCGPIPWISVTFDDSVFVEPQLTNLLNDLERLAIPATFFICPTCYRGDVSFCSQLARVIDAGHSIQSRKPIALSLLVPAVLTPVSRLNVASQFQDAGYQCDFRRD